MARARPKTRLTKDGPQPSALAKRIIERWGDAGGDVPLDRVISELGDVQRYDIVASLKELERAGAGEFMVARAGRKAHFVWSRGRSNLVREDSARKTSPGAREALAANSNAKSRRAAVKAGEGRSARQASSAKSARLEHVFHLRSDFLVTVTLPADITSTEMERFCHFLRSIPFDGELD